MARKYFVLLYITRDDDRVSTWVAAIRIELGGTERVVGGENRWTPAVSVWFCWNSDRASVSGGFVNTAINALTNGSGGFVNQSSGGQRTRNR
jgi:hypothetical protein